MSGGEPSSLAVAVCDGDLARVEELLGRGDPMDRRDPEGRTPLMLALLAAQMDIARLLVERGADTNRHDHSGRYPLHVSLLRPDVGVTEMMLARGARPDLPDGQGVTPLHLAAACGRAPLVTRLMKQLAPLEARDETGATPLHMAALNDRPAATRALLRGEPDLRQPLGDGRTALFVAVEKGAHRVVELLMAAGADPEDHCRYGRTPLSLAYNKQDYQAVELMHGPGTRARIEAGLAAATEHAIPEDHCEELEARLDALRETIGPITNEPRFDVSRFLEVFDRVRLQQGHVLDFYHQRLDDPPPPGAPRLFPMDAEPYVFTRPEDQPHDEAGEIAADLYWRRPHLMKHLAFEPSPDGLLQWVIFRTAVTQFHLCWHSQYNDMQYILSPAGLERVLESLPLSRVEIKPYRRYTRQELEGGSPLAETARETLRALDLTPRVILAGDLGEVRALTFTKWGGFAWRHSHLRRPHHIDRVETEVVVGYNCGVRF